LGNPSEMHIVEDGVTGIIAPNEKSYVRAIEGLYQNPDLRKKLSENARKAAKIKYSIELMVQRWEEVFGEVLSFPKTPRQWTGRRRGNGTSAAQVFIESLGEYGKEFEKSLTAQSEKDRKSAIEAIKKLYASSPLWKANTRGTSNHYHLFFPEDDVLKQWRDIAAAEPKNAVNNSEYNNLKRTASCAVSDDMSGQYKNIRSYSHE
jgi:hypothetical protein